MTDRDYYGHVSNGMVLYHYGILGMHWGIRRFQPYRKGEHVKGGKEVGAAKRQSKIEELQSKTAVQRAENDYNRSKHEGKLEDAQAKLDVATAKANLKNVKANGAPMAVNNNGQQKYIEPTNQKREELKQKIIRSGDPKLIKQYSNILNNDEYRQAKDRMQMRNDLQRAIKDEKFNKAKSTIDKFTAGAQSVGNAVNSVKDSYNRVAEMQNFLNPNKKWKKITDGKPDYAAQQKQVAANNAREAFRRAYGFDPFTGNRAKSVYDPSGNWLRYATSEEERTGIIRENVDAASALANAPNSFVGPQQMTRRYMMV